MLGHKNISTTQTYLSATNTDLKRTQQLLVRGVEEEELSLMPENIVVNKNLFNEYKKEFVPNLQMGLGKGVPNPKFQ